MSDTYRAKWAAVRKGVDGYDVWRWNPSSSKWVRMSRTACGYATLRDAIPVADEVSEEIEAIRRDLVSKNEAPDPGWL